MCRPKSSRALPSNNLTLRGCSIGQDASTALRDVSGRLGTVNNVPERPWRLVMGNERLRAAMTAATVDVDAVSTATAVDPKTVQRWLSGRLPHPRHRWKLIELLDEEEAYLWPDAVNGRTMEASKAELLTLYPHRADVPLELWRQLFEHAERAIDVLVYAGTFLHEQLPELNDLLRERADAGCRIRVALGDPEGERIRWRGQEEQFGLGIATRCELALMHYRPLIEDGLIKVRIH